MTRGALESLRELSALIDQGGEALWPATERAGARTLLRGLIAALERRATPYGILLLGGTGVGKSTLLNALAGATLVDTSIVRAHTSRLQIYHHQDDALPPLWAALQDQSMLLPHRLSALAGKLLVDAPDGDSHRTEHRALLARAVDAADACIYIVTPEKYYDAALPDLLAERLAAHRHLLPVLNKIDELADPSAVANAQTPTLKAVLADAQRRLGETFGRPLQLRPLSARRALAGGDPGCEELRAYIERDLDVRAIRELRAGELHTAFAALRARLDVATGGARSTALEAWRTAALERAGPEAGALGQILEPLEEGDLSRLAAWCYALSFRGIFGAFMSLVWGLRAILRPGYPRPGQSARLQLLARIQPALAPDAERRLTEASERLALWALKDAVEHGLRASADGPPSNPTFPQTLTGSLQAARRRALDELLADTIDGPARRGRDVLAAIPPLAWSLGLAAFMAHGLVWRADPRYLELLTPGLLALGLIFLFEARLAEYWIQRRARRFVARLRRDQDAAIEALLAAGLARQLDLWIAPLELWLGRCRALVQSLGEDLGAPAVGEADRRIQK